MLGLKSKSNPTLMQVVSKENVAHLGIDMKINLLSTNIINVYP
jgi:hypothetical protein